MYGDEFYTGESGDIAGEFGAGDNISGQAESGANEYLFSDGIGDNAIASDGSRNQSGNTGFGSGQQYENIGKEEETTFLVGDGAIGGQALEESIVNALRTVFADDESTNVMAGESDEVMDPTPTPTIAPMVTPSPVPSYAHNIDDIYELLEGMENYSALTYADNLEYHKSQDIIGRASIGLLSVALGGLVIVAFIGRIR